MQRPKGVEITTWIMALSLTVWIVQLAIFWNPMPGIHATPKVSLEEARTAFRVIEVFAGLLAITVLISYWKGREWARTLVLFDCVVSLYALLHVYRYWQTSHFNAVKIALNALLSIFLLWYLFRPAVRIWFKEQTLQACRARHPKPA